MNPCINDRSHLLLERLLAAHAESFDVEHTCEFAGRAFHGHARFHSAGERYVLTRRAKLWGVNVFEHILFLCIDHLDQALLDELVAFMRTDALQEVELVPDHMTTYLSLVLIADSADDEALRAVRKTSFRKNFAFGLKGWADLRLCAVDLSTNIVAANAMGKDLAKTIEANLLAE